MTCPGWWYVLVEAGMAASAQGHRWGPAGVPVQGRHRTCFQPDGSGRGQDGVFSGTPAGSDAAQNTSMATKPAMQGQCPILLGAGKGAAD